jgi:four helix bundle protein
MSYRNLEVWQLARRLTAEIHRMTLTNLPKFEMYEEGSQIRRSMKSVRSNLVEGYGRRRYRLDYIRFLTYAQASCDEITDHLNILHETGSLRDDEVFESIAEHLDELGRKLNRFIQSVERDHGSVREDDLEYGADAGDISPGGESRQSRDEYRATSIEHPTSDADPEIRDDGESP